MDDTFIFKLKTIENDLRWFNSQIDENSFFTIIESEEKRRIARELLIRINRHAQSIQSKIGTEFNPEFQDAKIFNTD